MVQNFFVFLRPFRFLVYGFVVQLGIVGCGEEKKESPPPSASPNFASLWATMFENRCSTCHAPGKENTGGPDLRTQAGFYAALVGRTAKDPAYEGWTTFQKNRVECLDRDTPFIDPGNPENSMVVAVLDATVTPCTVLNHVTTGRISQTVATPANIAALKQWITAGAKQ